MHALFYMVVITYPCPHPDAGLIDIYVCLHDAIVGHLPSISRGLNVPFKGNSNDDHGPNGRKNDNPFCMDV